MRRGGGKCEKKKQKSGDEQGHSIGEAQGFGGRTRVSATLNTDLRHKHKLPQVCKRLVAQLLRFTLAHEQHGRCTCPSATV